jgi:adiponectin receptor
MEGGANMPEFDVFDVEAAFARSLASVVAAEKVETGDGESDEEDMLMSSSSRDTYTLSAYGDTPRFLRAPFILTGYRVYFSWALCVQSLARLHNETWNTWTHILGALYFLYRALMVIPDNSNLTHVVLLFDISAMLCFLLSSTFHLCGCHSAPTHARLYRCDIAGICALILGSYFPGIYLAFLCTPVYQATYLSVVALLLVLTLVSVNVRRCQTQKLHYVRVGLLVSVVAFAVVPIVHWLIIGSEVLKAACFSGVLQMLALYALGFAFYWAHAPECWAPGRFDHWLHSHQIWHICVVCAAGVTSYISTITFFRH